MAVKRDLDHHDAAIIVRIEPAIGYPGLGRRREI